MKKIFIIILFITVLSFSISKENFSLGVGTDFENPIIKLETNFFKDDKNEIGIGISYEGFRQKIYVIEPKEELLKDIRNDNSELLEIVKDIIKDSLAGTKKEDSNDSGLSVALGILKSIKTNDLNTFRLIEKKLGTAQSIALETLMQGYPDGYLLSWWAKWPDGNITVEKLVQTIMEKPEILENTRNSIHKSRNDVPDEYKEKVDTLVLRNLIEVLPTFVDEELKKMGKYEEFKSDKERDILNLDLFSAFNYLGYLKDKDFNENLNFDIKAYEEATKEIRNFKIDGNNIDVNNFQKNYNTIQDYLKLIVKKNLPDVEIVDVDVIGIKDLLTSNKGINETLDSINSLKIPEKYKDKVLYIATPTALALNKDRIKLVTDKYKIHIEELNAKIKPSGLSGYDLLIYNKNNNVNIKKEYILSHNINTYFYAKQKFTKNNVKPYIREEIGLIAHLNNPYANLSLTTGLGIGIEVDNKVSIDFNSSLVLPLVSKYNNKERFQNLQIVVPSFLKFSLIATYNFGK